MSSRISHSPSTGYQHSTLLTYHLTDPTLNARETHSAEVDLPAYITAIFDGLANVIAAAGGAAANTIAATGGAIANGLDSDGTVPAAVSNSTLAGRAKLDKVGRAVAVELTEALAGRGRV